MTNPNASVSLTDDEDEVLQPNTLTEDIVFNPLAAGHLLEPVQHNQSNLDDMDSVTLPPVLNWEPAMPESLTGSGFKVALYADGCVNCSHLFPHPDNNPQDSCHFTVGNTNCPAAYIRFEVVGKRISLLKRITEARNKKDSNRVLQLLTKLDELNLDDKNWVLSQIGLII